MYRVTIRSSVCRVDLEVGYDYNHRWWVWEPGRRNEAWSGDHFLGTVLAAIENEMPYGSFELKLWDYEEGRYVA